MSFDTALKMSIEATPPFGSDAMNFDSPLPPSGLGREIFIGDRFFGPRNDLNDAIRDQVRAARLDGVRELTLREAKELGETWWATLLEQLR